MVGVKGKKFDLDKKSLEGELQSLPKLSLDETWTLSRGVYQIAKIALKSLAK